MTDLTLAGLDEELDDFESDDFEDEPEADHSYLRGMWSSYGFKAGGVGDRTTQDLVTAHGMVESFVNAFARDGRYRVVFDANVSTAGTNMTEKVTAITPAPVIDPTLTAEEAGLILTGLAVHEISHPRYGRGTWSAVEAAFPHNSAASRLSNLLDDIRIERRFVEDYPGYAGVFAPTLDYIGKAGTKNGLNTPKLSDPVNLAISATRYPTFAKWNAATSAEAAWWTDWATRWSKFDAPRKHVEAIREALVHVANVRAANPAPKPASQAPSAPSAPSTETSGDADAQDAIGEPTHATQGDKEATQSDTADSGEDTDDSSGDDDLDATGDAASMSDKELNEATQGADADEEQHASSCSGSASVEAAARKNGAEDEELNGLKRDADATVENARNLDDDGHGHLVDVAQSLKGLVYGGYTKPSASATASRYIRNAILRSRGGHTDIDSYKQRGRLDQRGMARIAHGDSRVFEQRKAPSPAKCLVWVMVDASGSMGGRPLMRAAQVAHAMADATNGTPTVRMEVYAWSSPFRRSSADSSGGAGVARAWRTGQDPKDILRMAGLRTGGTPDATTMRWATKAIRHEVRPEETPVIIFISDGAGEGGMNEAIAEARRKGIKVFGVSFGESNDQEKRYGRGNWVPFAGSIIQTARPLADLFARLTSSRGR
jgi:hypothetical protein